MGLTPGRWREVLLLHAGALALPEAEREAFLERECADEELRAEVRRMLAAPDTDAFLEPPALDQPAAGRDLGDFTLLEEIGRGGMGVVYRALQRSLGRIVAVKVLPASFALPQRTIERFEREAHTMARLAHPNLVAILACGEERGLRYIAMEYVDGPNLAQELLRLRADLGAEDDRRAHLPSSRASDYFRFVAEAVRQVADGLASSHEHGIVHRDIKPSNLLLDPSGRVKVVDFGLARDEHLGSLSISGDLVGTPHYMSPEQARAHRHVVDHRTDIYSLGVVLYELLTLQRPHDGRTSQEVINHLLQREPARIRKLNHHVPRDLETICMTAMAKEPRGRYADAAGLRDDLARFLAHQAILARPPSLPALALRFCRRHARSLAAAALLLVGSLGGWKVSRVLGAERIQVSITAPGHDGAIVWDRLLTPLTAHMSPARRMGTTPIVGASVARGLHRFTIEVPGVGFAELTRVLVEGDHVHELSARILPTAEVLGPEASMVEIPSGEFVYGVEVTEGDDGWPAHYRRQMVSLPTYWIDRYEVSNAQYLEFTRATGHPRPDFWPEEGSAEWLALPEVWPRLPVTGVSYRAAQAFAEWAGKRLPTDWEWEKAARGTVGWELPWQADSAGGHEGSTPLRAVVDRPYRTAVREALHNYLAEVAPVDSYPEGRSPSGLHHVLGNALEWTESLWYVPAQGGGAEPDWNTHLTRGGAFDQQPGGWNLCGFEYGPADHQESSHRNGFRCAKSAVP
ncbi:MAG TPA: bifunctional serine/threonine-protein kinase/formylglycine-generating enzyme family protein [Planctomycetota bacterium]